MTNAIPAINIQTPRFSRDAMNRMAAELPVHSPAQTEKPLAFGNASGLAQRFFQPITENYLWAFMAQDVLGLWIPRIYGSLERGRIKYDEKKDPHAVHRSPSQQRRYHILKTIRGLNYWNGWEETAREIQNGPGIFIGQGFLYAGAAAWMLGKRGLLIGYKDLQQYFGQLGQVLTPELAGSLRRLPQQKAHQALTERFTKHILEGHFGALDGTTNPALKESIQLARPISLAARKLLPASDLSIYNWCQKHFPRELASDSGITYQDVLNKWLEKYVPIVTKRDHRRLARMENFFDALLCHYNNTVKKVSDPSLLDHFTLPKLPGAKEAQVSSSRDVLNTVDKMTTVLDDVLKLGKKYQAKNATQISKLLNYFERHLIQKKFPLSIIATIVGCCVVTYTAILSQRKDRKYPANRLIPLPQDHDARLKKLFKEQQMAEAQEQLRLEESAKAQYMQRERPAAPSLNLMGRQTPYA